ncbi:MAG TPA: peptide chain release factor 1 [Chloroflexota bacterium]|nr:peptide chain release factor 1 [Chloroflexota bacterium]
MFEKLKAIEARYEELSRLVATAAPDELAGYGRELAAIEEVVTLYRLYMTARRQLTEAEDLLRGEQDEDMRDLVRAEMDAQRQRRDTLERQITLALIPRDPNDDKNVVVEIRAGAGGDEAALFASDLFRLYTRYAEGRRWQVELVNANENGIHGFKEIVFDIKGKGAYSRLKYEGGVHRVQRIPVTESGGRIHTSTATVAVMPEAEEVDVRIDESDLRIDVYRSTGHGGQSVNTTDSAVRITHLPTGLVVTCQDEKSQLKNKNKAMTVLRSRLLSQETQRRQQKEDATRRSQVGSGDRSEKIRTYNFPQDRVTDHRINVTLHRLPDVMDGNIDALIDALNASDQAERLQAEVLPADAALAVAS